MATSRKGAATKGKPSQARRGSPRRGSPVAAARRTGPSPWTLAAIAVIVLLVAGLTTYFVTRPSSEPGPPQGVQTFPEARGHVNGNVDYPQTPPAGGKHNPVWLNCGIYTKPVPNENAVHDLEHGAVWITYRPNLPPEQVSKLQDMVQGKTFLDLSPYPGLPAPVVASAWGKQLQLQSASDPRLPQFIRYYRLGPQTPEPGAPCTGGTGNPQ